MLHWEHPQETQCFHTIYKIAFLLIMLGVQYFFLHVNPVTPELDSYIFEFGYFHFYKKGVVTKLRTELQTV